MPLTLKLETWDPKIHGRMLVMSSYGGWIKLRNLALYLVNANIFKKTGDVFGGFLDFANENSSLIECLEVVIKVKRELLQIYSYRI